LNIPQSNIGMLRGFCAVAGANIRLGRDMASIQAHRPDGKDQFLMPYPFVEAANRLFARNTKWRRTTPGRLAAGIGRYIKLPSRAIASAMTSGSIASVAPLRISSHQSITATRSASSRAKSSYRSTSRIAFCPAGAGGDMTCPISLMMDGPGALGRLAEPQQLWLRHQGARDSQLLRLTRAIRSPARILAAAVFRGLRQWL